VSDIAAEAGVSKGLVSLILRGEPGPAADTTSRVLAVADRLGYRPNRSARLLAARRTRMLGVTMSPGNPFHGELVEELQSAADEQGYELVIGAVTAVHSESRAIETLVGFRCEAVILLGPDLPADELAQLLSGVPTISLGRPLDLPNADVIRVRDGKALAMLVDHLVGLGHRRIAHVDGGSGSVCEQRSAGYTAAMLARRLAPIVLQGGSTEAAGARAAEAVVRVEGVTAVVAYNDRCAVGLLDAFDRAGRSVPGDISVTGFDDSALARLRRIDLTTIGQSPTEQARRALAMAMSRTETGGENRQDVILDPVLVVRGSTGSPR
jgi:LacI family transcriptional regulator